MSPRTPSPGRPLPPHVGAYSVSHLFSYSLIAHSSVLYSSPDDLSKHSFFKYIKWDVLRCVRAPFVPALDSEIDTGYNDDFSSPEDMAKYSEAEEKYANKGLGRAGMMTALLLLPTRLFFFAEVAQMSRRHSGALSSTSSLPSSIILFCFYIFWPLCCLIIILL